MLPSGNDSLFSIRAALAASVIARLRRSRRLCRDARIPPSCLDRPRVLESRPTTRTLTIVSFEKGGERGWLRNGHDRLECQRTAVRVMTIRHARDGVAEDLDGRFRQVLVVVRRTGLSQILEQPRRRLTGFCVQLGLDRRRGRKVAGNDGWDAPRLPGTPDRRGEDSLA